jgi:Uma2 family endonuclease
MGTIMVLPPLTQTMTIDEFEQFLTLPENRDRNFELIDGSIVEKAMPTDEHSIITGLIIVYVGGFTLERGLRPPGPERRFVFPNDTQDSRQPDVSLILDPAVPIVTQGPMHVIPDFIVEVKSPDDTYEDMREKARFYTERGVRLVLLVFPRPRLVEVYRPGLPSEILTVDDTLEGYDVLPGFSLPVARLFVTTGGG